jgi:ribosomal protein S18 acetylase RimI-like enzyme
MAHGILRLFNKLKCLLDGRSTVRHLLFVNVVLRAATIADLAFARELYLGPMREVCASLFEWDEARQIATFDAQFVPGEVSIFTLGSEDIGWYQLGVSDDEIFLKQIHIREKHRQRGIGTSLLRALVDHGAAERKVVRLGVVRTNRARSLYERLGFRVTHEDAYKLYMERGVWGSTGLGP